MESESWSKMIVELQNDPDIQSNMIW